MSPGPPIRLSTAELLPRGRKLGRPQSWNPRKVTPRLQKHQPVRGTELVRGGTGKRGWIGWWVTGAQGSHSVGSWGRGRVGAAAGSPRISAA